MKHARWAGCAWLAWLIAAMLLRNAAHAQHSQPAEVLIVLAKEEAGEIDPQLSEYQALRKPPFTSFGSMKVLSREKLRLQMGNDSTVALPNGRKMKVRLEQVAPDGRFRVSTSINRPDKPDYLPLLTVLVAPGDPFFVAGQSYQGGTLVIGVRLLGP